MKNKELSDKYCSRFVAEGLIKSALCASTLGFALSLISAIVSLSTGTKLIWLSALLFLAADAVGIPLFYYAKFRPKTMQMANRLDKSGLQERVVTMLELADEQTRQNHYSRFADCMAFGDCFGFAVPKRICRVLLRLPPRLGRLDCDSTCNLRFGRSRGQVLQERAVAF